ncbi:MAG: winged helix-turn-helix domain-containing protein, partial [Microbacteriaceae bacterium]|nr:winged helix-turn-helix domain-containing protein [Microbacteriaceae bacterium]
FETEANQRKGSWWGWSELKQALEYMFLVGDLVSGGRDAFKRLYALPEQILPKHVLAQHPSEEEAKKKLLLQATTALGVGTFSDIADWHRMNPTRHKKIFDDLVESGDIVEAKVAGWQQPGFVSAKTSLEGLESKSAGPRTTILSPFDPVCWKRDRIERMFGFEYRIEIYTPEPKRVFGYYTLPILHNRNLVGRIDLKSDRQGRRLLAQMAKALTKHLKEVQSWQGLQETIIMPKGNLSLELSTHLA